MSTETIDLLIVLAVMWVVLVIGLAEGVRQS